MGFVKSAEEVARIEAAVSQPRFSGAQMLSVEFLAGFGKTARDGLHLKAAAVRETCDVVISNVVVIDAALGIRKVSIGIREGRICSIGRAGNPDWSRIGLWLELRKSAFPADQRDRRARAERAAAEPFLSSVSQPLPPGPPPSRLN